jgi:fatty acid CoA ligase FadD9
MPETVSAPARPPKSAKAQYAIDLRQRLLVEDRQFQAAMPDPKVTEAKTRPGLGLAQVLAEIMQGYGDRPCLGERARRHVTDPATGRTLRQAEDHFDVITYREQWDRVRALAAFWQGQGENGLHANDFVTLIGFPSIGMTVAWMAGIHVGAVLVPMHANAPMAQLQRIADETQPRWMAASGKYLDTAVDLILAGHRPGGLLLFDHDPAVDDERDRLDHARARLAHAGMADLVVTLEEAIALGTVLPPPVLFAEPDTQDRLCTIFYTSGSTGQPKGAMIAEAAMKQPYLTVMNFPPIAVHYMPMNHSFGPTVIMLALGNGGTCCFTSADLSDIFEDIRIVRPTSIILVPRLCEMLYGQYTQEFARRAPGSSDHEELRHDILAEMRHERLGGRVVRMNFGSAPLSPTLKTFIADLVGIPLDEAFGSTEASGILFNNRIARPPVIDYKLDDVPELGYFKTDRPWPRGELLVKSSVMMLGYFNQPELTSRIFDEEGYYRTGDIMAEIGPDKLVYVDRRNNVIKLAQAEFVAVERLEGLFFDGSPLIRQIFLYGTSLRSFLLGVIVPDMEVAREMGLGDDEKTLRASLRQAIQQVAEQEQLHAYEVPRDFIIEREPFSPQNGLLTVSGKYARPTLTAHYAPRLEAMYDEIAARQVDELDRLRAEGGQGAVFDTVISALRATLGLEDIDTAQDQGFADFGGDSLAALNFSLLLGEIFGIEVPVGVITGPSTSLRTLARYIEQARSQAGARPTFASVHGAGATTIRAADLALDRFFDAGTIAAGKSAAPPAAEVKTVLVTGATGFLGRFLLLEWLERMAPVGGKVVAIVRGRDDADALARLAAVFDSGDADLTQRFAELAAGHLEVRNGDLANERMGLSETAWSQLAGSVDLIVHPAAFVNHVLPYSQLFGPNVVGTAELIRLAITERLKPIINISSIAVTFLPGGSSLLAEDADVREAYPVLDTTAAGYATGYGMSKWAGEVLLRNAHEAFGLPVSIFRCGMILAHSRYAGQLNLPDMFTRLLLSISLTGLAPATFYREGVSSPHYDGLPVDFMARAINELGLHARSGIQTFHVVNPHDDGVSMDTFVDWIAATGRQISRIADYADWLDRFTTALKALPEHQRQRTSLPLLHSIQKQERGHALVPASRFREGIRQRGLGEDGDIPHLSATLIAKYLRDLEVTSMLPESI